jgi:hypothetical protein
LQVVVDHEIRFCDVLMGLMGYMNDSIILLLFSLYSKTTYNGLFDPEHGSQDNIHPYILGDKGYLLLPWFMIPHKQNANVRHYFRSSLSQTSFKGGRVWSKMPLEY